MGVIKPCGLVRLADERRFEQPLCGWLAKTQ